jgi:hypothetical protein
MRKIVRSDFVADLTAIGQYADAMYRSYAEKARKSPRLDHHANNNHLADQFALPYVYISYLVRWIERMLPAELEVDE